MTLQESDDHVNFKIADDMVLSNTLTHFQSINFGNFDQEFARKMQSEELLANSLDQILFNFSKIARCRQGEVLNTFIESSGLYSLEQLQFLNPFILEFSQKEDYESAIKLCEDFESEIIASSMAEEEKVMLVQFSASSLTIAKFAKEGGIKKISNKMIEDLGITSLGGRINGDCKVDMRDVWLGAVLGGTVRGITGAGGGTIVIPGIGTATGAIAGGVVGFASGFLEGALLTTAGSLLATCFRPDPNKCGTPGNPECLPDSKNQELIGKTKASCDQMRGMGFAEFQLPSICRKNIYYSLPR